MLEDVARAVAPRSAVVERPAAASRGRSIALASGIVILAFGIAMVVGGGEVAPHALPVAAVVAAALAVLARTTLGAVRAGVVGAFALGLLTVIPLAMVLVGLRDSGELRLAVTLVGIGTIPLVAGTVPAMLLANLHEGRREDVTPCLLASAACGGVGVLASIASTRVFEFGDDRLVSLVPYVAAAMALLAVADVLAYHRIGAGFPGTVAVVALAAITVEAFLFLDRSSGAAEAAATAVTVGGGVAAGGLFVATALATPRPLVVSRDDAAGGPRFAPLLVAGFVAAAAALRLWSVRPLWMDEAETAQLTDGSLHELLDSTSRARAQPPLHDALVWGSRQLFGSSTMALRLPALVAGLLLVPVVYVAGAKLFDRRVGLIAAALVAVGPGFVWLSDEAQPGALAALLTTVSLLMLVLAVRRDRVTDWLLFGVASALLLWSHQLAVVPVVVLQIAACLTHLRGPPPRARRAARWLLSLAIDGAAFVALLIYRGGLGAPSVLPPFEYATVGAPGAGRSVFGLAGAALTGLLGFHPADVTSRLLALWPVCMLAAFILLGRSWSRRGVLVVVLAACPFATLLVLQVLGHPRNPPFALVWTATAMPMVALALAYVINLAGRWPVVRLLAVALVAVLIVAAVDQARRVDPLPRYDIAAAVQRVGAEARAGDVVIYGPDDIADVVRSSVRTATVIPVVDAPDSTGGAPRVHVIGAFAWRQADPAVQPMLDLVRQLAASRPLLSESGTQEVKVWTFG